MEWIGCTVCEIFAFKLYYDLDDDDDDERICFNVA